jgi:hypothetical protein
VSSWEELGVHGAYESVNTAVHGVHGERSRFLAACSRAFTAHVLARDVSVHTGRGVYKTPYREHVLEQLQALLLASFPGSEVVFEYVDSEPQLEAQADHLHTWNEWVSVLAEDRVARA